MSNVTVQAVILTSFAKKPLEQLRKELLSFHGKSYAICFDDENPNNFLLICLEPKTTLDVRLISKDDNRTDVVATIYHLEEEKHPLPLMFLTLDVLHLNLNTKTQTALVIWELALPSVICKDSCIDLVDNKKYKDLKEENGEIKFKYGEDYVMHVALESADDENRTYFNLFVFPNENTTDADKLLDVVEDFTKDFGFNYLEENSIKYKK